jgi:hypothetical protein
VTGIVTITARRNDAGGKRMWVRAKGAGMAAIGLLIGWMFILAPVAYARAGGHGAKVNVLAFFVSPVCIVVGLMLLIGGEAAQQLLWCKPETEPQKRLQGIAALLMLLLAGLTYLWLFVIGG